MVSFVIGASCGVDVFTNGFIGCLKLKDVDALLVPAAPKITGAADLLVPVEACIGAEPNPKLGAVEDGC